MAPKSNKPSSQGVEKPLMAMMEAGIVSLDTHPDPKLPTASTARPFQRLSHRPHARHCNWSRV